MEHDSVADAIHCALSKTDTVITYNGSEEFDGWRLGKR